MWFVRLVKLKDPPSKESMAKFDQLRAEASKWGIKFHETFFTLGSVDVVNIFEAPDMKTAMRWAMTAGPWTMTAETLQAASREEVDSWVKSM